MSNLRTTGGRLTPPSDTAALPPLTIGSYGVRIFRGVPYAELPGCRPLELDLYLPPDASGRVPVTLFLHGGGWRRGTRHACGPVFAGEQPNPFEKMAAAGIAVASADYRLSGEARWPAPLHDVKAAIRWVRLRAEELGIDPQRIAAWGESAGGHLAALIGVTQGDPDFEGETGVAGFPSSVSCVVAWYPPSDLAALPLDAGEDPTDPTTREALMLGSPPGAVPELTAQASPVTHVSAKTPPFLLLHGGIDTMVPVIQSRRFATLLESSGVDVELEIYEGAEHMWLQSPETPARALDRTIGFLASRLCSAGPPT